METKVSMFSCVNSSLSSSMLQPISPGSISSFSSSSSSSSGSPNTGLISLMIPSSTNSTPFLLDDQLPPAPPNVPYVSDEELAQLSVRQLNQRLQGQDRQVVSYLKQKRRTLKNRGYALTCRVRRIQSQLKLEADNLMLRDQVRHLKQTVQSLQSRLHYYEPLSSISSLTSISSARHSPTTSSPLSSSICSSRSSTILPQSPSELYVAQLPYSVIPFTNPYQNTKKGAALAVSQLAGICERRSTKYIEYSSRHRVLLICSTAHELADRERAATIIIEIVCKFAEHKANTQSNNNDSYGYLKKISQCFSMFSPVRKTLVDKKRRKIAK